MQSWEWKAWSASYFCRRRRQRCIPILKKDKNSKNSCGYADRLLVQVLVLYVVKLLVMETVHLVRPNPANGK